MINLNRIIIDLKFSFVKAHHETIHVQPHMLSTRCRMSLVHEIKYASDGSRTCTFESRVWVWAWVRFWVSACITTEFRFVIPGTCSWIYRIPVNNQWWRFKRPLRPSIIPTQPSHILRSSTTSDNMCCDSVASEVSLMNVDARQSENSSTQHKLFATCWTLWSVIQSDDIHNHLS